MFDQLKDDDKKQKESEKEMEKFHETLQHLSDDDMFENTNSQIFDVADTIHKEEPFIKKRVIPPSRGRGRRPQRIVEGKDYILIFIAFHKLLKLTS